MKKPERYVYPAVFTYEPGQEIAVVFPDLDTATSGVSDDDALFSARELLGCVLFGLEEAGEPIPAPTPLSALRTMSGPCWLTSICPLSAWHRSTALSTAPSPCRPGSMPQLWSAM